MINTSYLLFFTDTWIEKVGITASKGLQTQLGPGYIIWSIMIWAVFGWALINFITNSRRLKGTQKLQLRYLFLGFGLWGVFVTIPDIVIPLIYKDTRFFSISAITSLFFTFAVGYTILRHRFLDIRFIIARTIAYTLLVLILGGLYSLGLFVIGQIITGKMANSQELSTSTVFALIIALSFQPLRKSLERITDRIFYKGYYNSQELLKSLSGIMATTLDLQLLSLRILGNVTQAMKIRKSVFVLLSKDENEIDYVEYEAYEEKPRFEKSDIDPFIADKRITIFDDLEEGETKEIMRRLNVSVALRLSVRNQKIGVLFLGEKSSGDIYSKQDIDVLEILAPQLSVAIQNSREYEEIKRFNITLKDEVDKATKDLQNANEKLKQMDKVKDEFVSVASHELRTPMTVIKSYVWLLLNDKTLKLTEKQKVNLDRTYASVERLITLVNDMLNVSRIESGKILIEKKPTDIEKLCQDTIAEMQAKAAEEKINLSLEREKDIPLVSIDPNKTKEILINLVGNALKFTLQGGKIKVSIENKDNMVLVKVSDTGFGIKAENMPKLFQKFGIVGENYLQKNITQGTGLGLYISKSIAELQGGKMWAESEGQNKGATFSFTVKPVN